MFGSKEKKEKKRAAAENEANAQKSEEVPVKESRSARSMISSLW